MSDTQAAAGAPSEELSPARARGRRKAAPPMKSSPIQGAYAALAILGVFASAQFWSWTQTRSGRLFPRKESEFLSASQLDRRLELAKQTLSADPGDPSALKDAGVLHFQKGKDFYIDGINELEEARKLGAVDVRIFYYLGVMYQEEGLYPFAIAEYQKFLRNQPEDKETRMLLAKLLFQNGQYEEAAVQYRWLHEHYRKDAVVMENLALTLLRINQTDEANKMFEALSEFGPNEARRAHYYLALAAVDAKDYQKAKEQFLSVMSDQPDLGLPLGDVHANIAANYDRLKLPILAKEHWEKALQYEPDNTAAKKALKSINAALKKSAKKKKR